MNDKDMYEYEQFVRAREELSKANDAVTQLLHTDPKFVINALRNEHRTFQQDFTRLCAEWLRTCAQDDYGTDARNEASHEVGKIATAAHDAAHDGCGIGLPRI